MSLIEKTAAELLALQTQGQASAREIADAFLAATAAREPKLKSFMLPPDPDAVRARAEEIDAKR
ncbi:MAG: Asp-tRNA(Asn)/Glu-tRNA(Gln) amidotransferase GatCAB subunit A, partial [Gemmataceae bacterium]|nr:Asp-tRNA(Asn)/Glu-tRNA(Gln) amidotransferase GatCAB subunit A [Gemmataceae bacterium]